MIVHALIAALLMLVQTPQVTPSTEPNVFIDLGTEHCANEIAIAAYENTREEVMTGAGAPVYVTYSAFAFETADDALRALDDIPRLVANTYGELPDVDLDNLIVEIPVDDYGDASVAYNLTTPVDDDDSELDALFIDLVAIVKGNQMALILLFNDSGPTRISPESSLETLVPFADTIDEQWDGTGDIANALPEPSDMPVGWAGGVVEMGDLPACE